VVDRRARREGMAGGRQGRCLYPGSLVVPAAFAAVCFSTYRSPERHASDALRQESPRGSHARYQERQSAPGAERSERQP